VAIARPARCTPDRASDYNSAELSVASHHHDRAVSWGRCNPRVIARRRCPNSLRNRYHFPGHPDAAYGPSGPATLPDLRIKAHGRGARCMKSSRWGWECSFPPARPRPHCRPFLGGILLGGHDRGTDPDALPIAPMQRRLLVVCRYTKNPSKSAILKPAEMRAFSHVN
jgi:hypothetical protein